jgi:hypothetical protein
MDNQITYVLAEAATAYHGAETDHAAATAALLSAQSRMAEARPVYFSAIAEALAEHGVRDIARTVGAACGRSKTAVERDIARVVVMTATGWDDAQTVTETPNVGQKNGPTCAALKGAADGAENKTAARAAVRALYAAPADGPDTDGADGAEGDDTEDTGPVDHGTAPGPDAMNIHDTLRDFLVAYIGQHESPADGVKNAARILSEAAALCEAAEEPATV